MFVQPKSGADLKAEEILDFCKQNLASYKKPKHVFFLAELPRNSIGKVLKRELAQLASNEIETAKN